MPSDLAILKAWLKRLNRDAFVALPPATRDGGPFDAADVHVAAAEAIHARGLPADTAYVGWHSQSEAFNRSGRMVGVQYIYHGGDLDRVRAELATVPERFTIDGGEDEETAFRLGLRFDPDEVGTSDRVGVSAALSAMGATGYWLEYDPRLQLPAPLDGPRLAWLHEVAVQRDLPDDLRSEAWRLLDSQDAVTDSELDTAVAELLIEPDGAWAGSSSSAVFALWQRGRHEQAQALAVAVGRAFATDDWFDGELLALAPGQETLAAARTLGLAAAEARIAGHLTSAEPWVEAIGIAERLRTEGRSVALERLVEALPQLAPALVADLPDDTVTWAVGNLARLLVEPTLPTWLRSALLERASCVLGGLTPDGTFARRQGHIYAQAERETLIEASGAMARAAQLVADHGPAAAGPAAAP